MNLNLQPQQTQQNAKEGAPPVNTVLDNIKVRKKKFCWFTKHNIRYIDYKDANFLLHFVNDQGKILPRRITGTRAKYQRRLAKAIKRARHLGLLPFVTDNLKSAS